MEASYHPLEPLVLHLSDFFKNKYILCCFMMINFFSEESQ